MKNMTLSNIAGACNAIIVGTITDSEQTIAGAVVDSRLIEKDYLFFAAKGERVDGHHYIKKAFEGGALAVVCERVPEGVDGIFLVVENSYKALYEVGKFYRKQLDIKVVGISGSVGKTSTKEFIANVLAQKYRVLKTEMNFNNEIGVPLMLLKIREEHEIAVLEMGISDFGEMSRLAAATQPDICVITNIGQCHLEKLIDRDGVKKAKTEMFDYMQPDGSVVLFGDDDKLSEITEVNEKKPLFYGTGENASVRAVDIINRGLWGSICTIQTGEGSFSTEISIPGKHMVYNALAATAVGTLFGLTFEEIEKGIATVSPVAGRSNLINCNNLTIIDDCYNANPISMRAAIDLLNEAVTRKVAVLGDMYELGEDEVALHEDVGEYAAKIADVLVCIGEISKAMYHAAVTYCEQNNKQTGNIYYFSTKEEFLEKMGQILHPQDAILLKASHGMEFPILLQALTKEGLRLSDTDSNTEAKENTPVKEKEENKEETVEEVAEETKTESGEAKEKTEEETSKDETENEEAIATEEQESTEAVAAEASEKQEKPKVSKTKKILILVAAVLLLAAIGTAAFFIVKLQKEKELTRGVLVYTKDEGLYSMQGNKSVEYTDEFVEDDATAQEIVNLVERTVRFGKGEKTIYYTKEADPSEGTFDLYYNKVNGKAKNEELVNAKMMAYVLDGNNNVYYMKKGDLFLYDAKKETGDKIAKHVTEFYLSKDKKAICYVSEKEMFYQVLDSDSEPVLVEKDIDRVYTISENLCSFVYYKNDGLYVHTEEGSTIRLASAAEVLTVKNPEKKMEIYFLKTDEPTACVADFMNDNLKSSAEETLYKEALQQKTVGMDIKTLCYYKLGMDTPKVLSNSIYTVQTVENEDGLLLVTDIEIKKNAKISMRDCFKEGRDIEDVAQDVYRSMENSGKCCIVKNGKMTALKKYTGTEALSKVYADSNHIYFASENADDGGQAVYQATTGGLLKGATKHLATDVLSMEGAFAGDVYYVTQGSNGIQLNNSKGLVCSNVQPGKISETLDQKSVLYVDGNNTLCCYKKGVSTTIANNVYDSYVGITYKNIWYLKDYESEYEEGDLCNYNGKEEKMVDTCVSGIVFIQ